VISSEFPIFLSNSLLFKEIKPVFQLKDYSTEILLLLSTTLKQILLSKEEEVLQELP